MEDEVKTSGEAAPKNGRNGAAAGGKPGAKKTVAGKSAARAAPAKPAAAPAAAVKLRRKDVVERVTTALGSKKGSVRDVVNATLAVLGEALKAGDSLDLPAFGKARVAKPGKANGDKAGAMTIKLRPGTAAAPGRKGAKEALAEPDEAG